MRLFHLWRAWYRGGVLGCFEPVGFVSRSIYAFQDLAKSALAPILQVLFVQDQCLLKGGRGINYTVALSFSQNLLSLHQRYYHVLLIVSLVLKDAMPKTAKIFFCNAQLIITVSHA